MQARINKTLVDKLQPDEKDQFVFDTILRGFVLKVTPGGSKVYQVRYRIGGRGSRLQTMTIGKHGSPWTPDQARSEAEQLLAKVALDIDPAAERKAKQAAAFTMAELADRYLIQHVEMKNKPTTQAEFRRLVETIIKPELGAMSVSAVSRADLSALHHRRRATPRTANHVLAVLSKMFNLAEVWGFRPDGSNPCRKIEHYRENKRERFLSESEVAALGEVLADCEANRMEMDSTLNAVRLLLLTGCRLSEALALRWDDVDIEAGALAIRDAKAGGRIHHIGAQTAAFLADMPRVSPWVLPATDPKKPLPKATLERSWRRIRGRAGLDDVHLHDLRHTVGTYAGQTGANAFLVRDKLGHKTLAMTGRYVNRDADPLRALSDVIENRITGALNAGKARGEGKPAAEVVPMRKRARDT